MGRRKRVHYAEPVRLALTALDPKGLAIAHLETREARVLGGLPGETVRARHLRRRKGVDLFASEALESIPAEQRVTPDCEAFGRCGGCVLQHMAGAEQVRIKDLQLRNRLTGAGLQPARWLPPLQGPRQGYRYKARLGVRSVLKKERVLVGFREFGTGWVTDTRQCTILHEAVGTRMVEISVLIGSLDAARRIPQIEVAAGDTQVALVLRHLDPLSVADRDRLTTFSRETGLLIFLQGGGLDSVEPLLADQPCALYYELPDEQLRILFTPTQFTQVNPTLNRAMVAQALRELAPQPTDHVLDLFCGIGNFSLPLARHAGHVTGVEGSQQLVEQAEKNAVLNQISNARFEQADLYGDYTGGPQQDWACDRLLLDPPRTGAEQVVRRMQELAPRRIVYVSCNPVTLVRDSAVLIEQGYRLEAAGMMDMFPHTGHVEAMAVFNQAG